MRFFPASPRRIDDDKTPAPETPTRGQSGKKSPIFGARTGGSDGSRRSKSNTAGRRSPHSSSVQVSSSESSAATTLSSHRSGSARGAVTSTSTTRGNDNTHERHQKAGSTTTSGRGRTQARLSPRHQHRMDRLRRRRSRTNSIGTRNNRREPLLQVDTSRPDNCDNNSDQCERQSTQYGMSSPRSPVEDYHRDVPQYEPPSIDNVHESVDDDDEASKNHDRYDLFDYRDVYNDDDINEKRQRDDEDDDESSKFNIYSQSEEDQSDHLSSRRKNDDTNLDSVDANQSKMEGGSLRHKSATSDNESNKHNARDPPEEKDVDHTTHTSNRSRPPMQDSRSCYGETVAKSVAKQLSLKNKLKMDEMSVTESAFARQLPSGSDATTVHNTNVNDNETEPTRYGVLIDPRPSGSTSLQQNSRHSQRHNNPVRHPYDAHDALSAISTNTFTVEDQTTFVSTEADTMITKDEEVGDDTSTFLSTKMFSEVETFSGRFGLMMSGDEGLDLMSRSEDGIILIKQRVAYTCIILTAMQLGILLIQLALCGVATLKINPLVGPYPDAFSEWGGKNAHLLVDGQQYFRLFTPALLHVGVAHLIVNAYCQLETCAYLEREWGSAQWVIIYVLSAVGSSLSASTFDPDTIGVLSSGPIMGLFGAKIAQTITWSMFALRNNVLENSSTYEHLGGVMCGAATLSLMSFFTYIDWSGHLGGLVTGILTGMIIFAAPLKSLCLKFVWITLALIGLMSGTTLLVKKLFFEMYLDEDLGDACQYFRNLYPEGYDCECVWE